MINTWILTVKEMSRSGKWLSPFQRNMRICRENTIITGKRIITIIIDESLITKITIAGMEGIIPIRKMKIKTMTFEAGSADSAF